MSRNFELDNNFRQIAIAVLIVIILGLAVSGFFLFIEKESYAAIYILPGSIIHNPVDNSVMYVYGVTLSESPKKVDFYLNTYIDNNIVNTKRFSLNNGETLEERVITRLPNTTGEPKKITLILITGSKSESVHFWINNTSR
jgi:hypothetical protein